MEVDTFISPERLKKNQDLPPGLRFSSEISKEPPTKALSCFGQEKKPININILGGTVSGTNRNRPWDKTGPLPGTNGDPSGLFLFLAPQ